MQIRDYVLNDEELKKLAPKRRKKTVSSGKTSFKVLFQSGCDFGIEKKIGRNVTELIILPSKDQCYFRKGKKIMNLTVKRMKDFVSDSTREKKAMVNPFITRPVVDASEEQEPDIPLPDVNWLDGLYDDNCFIADFVNSVKDKVITPMIKNDVFFLVKRSYQGNLLAGNALQLFYSCYSDSPVLIKYLLNLIAERHGITRSELLKKYRDHDDPVERAFLASSKAFSVIEKAFGIEWAIKTADMFLESGTETSISGHLLQMIITDTARDTELVLFAFEGEIKLRDKISQRDIRNNIVFSAKNFVDYLIYHPISEGFLGDTDGFLKHWHDYLCGQKEIYGEIREKYPKNLESDYKRIKYKLTLHKEEIEQRKWSEALKKMKAYEYTGEKYMIVCPKEREDLNSEGNKLHNCVGSFIRNVCFGRDMILFVRKKDAPDDPFVTAQVGFGGKIVQVLGNCNSKPDPEVMEFIQEWADNKSLIVDCDRQPMGPTGLFEQNLFYENDDEDVWDDDDIGEEFQ